MSAAGWSACSADKQGAEEEAQETTAVYVASSCSRDDADKMIIKISVS